MRPEGVVSDMDNLDDVLAALAVEIDGRVGYAKASELSENLELSAREVAVRLLELGDDPEVPISIEKWSKTQGSTTYHISLDRDMDGNIETLIHQVA